MPPPEMSNPTEKDRLLPPRNREDQSTSHTIYTFQGPPPSSLGPPPPPRNPQDPGLPTNSSNRILHRRIVKRRPPFCGPFATALFTIFAVLLLIRPAVLLWHVMNGHHDRSDSTLSPLPGCPPLVHVRQETFSFDDPRGFLLEERATVHNIFLPKRIGGKVVVRQAPDSQTSKVEALVVYGSWATGVVDVVTFDVTDSSLSIDVSSHTEADYSEIGTTDIPQPCLSVDVYLSIKADVTFDSLHLELEHLGVKLEHGLSMIVNDQTTISTLSSSVHADDGAELHSRKTVVNVESGSITGSFNMLDLLMLTTKSGGISVDVTPAEASKSDPQPASLIARSHSGSIHITNLLERDLPDRDYHTEVVSASGTVSGTYIHGSRTLLKSLSGSIKADVLPFEGADTATTFTTEAYSGGTDLNLRAPYHDSDRVLSKMESKHTSQSGSLKLRYPSQWEGTIDGSVLSGSIHLGHNIRIIEDHKLGPIRTVKAAKGDGSSHVAFDTKSGSATIEIE